MDDFFRMRPATTNTALPRRPWYSPSLTTQIFIGLILGGFLGWVRPEWGNKVYFLRDIFLNLIKSIIAPLVFSTIVVGIAGAGSLKKVGRMGSEGDHLFRDRHHRGARDRTRNRQPDQAGHGRRAGCRT